MTDERPAEDLAPGVDVVGTTDQTVPPATDEKRQPAARERVRGRFRWERLVRDSDLPKLRRLVLYALSTYMDNDTGEARPGQELIAQAAALPLGTVRQHLRAAVFDGWLDQVGRGGRRGDGTPIAVTYCAATPVTTTRHQTDDSGDEWSAPDSESGAGYEAVRYPQTASPVSTTRHPSALVPSRTRARRRAGKAGAAPSAPDNRPRCPHGRSPVKDIDGFPVCQDCEHEQASA